MLDQNIPRVSTLRGPPRLRESESAGCGLEPGVCGELRGAVVMISPPPLIPAPRESLCPQLPTCFCFSLFAVAAAVATVLSRGLGWLGIMG